MKVDIDVGKIVRERTEQANRALGNLAQTVLDDSNFYIPRDQDQLISSGRTETPEEGAQVHWNTPYARFLYYGKLMVGKNSRSAWARPNETKVVTDKDIVYSKDKNPNAQKEWFEAAKKTKLAEWIRKLQKMIGG